MSADLLERAGAWLADDPDPDTRAELAAVLDAAAAGEATALADLADRFAGPLEFGTAGLRGRMGAGPHRMNRAVVLRAAAGLSAYLRRHGGRALVVGYDARHRSDVFARDTCSVATAAGLRVSVLPRPLPTPVLAYAVRALDCDAGVVVTASHNPPADNGYKVYLGDGSQIVPPADAEISAAIAAVGPLTLLPRADDGWTTLGEEVLEDYLSRAAAVAVPGGPRDLRMVYTPMHGVGRDVVLAALGHAGFPPPVVVAEQAEPDPDFPTVAFPNPEEPGAMDLALGLAAATGADLVVANDPDADRCAVGAAFGDEWRMLTGDELGALLGEYVAARSAPDPDAVLACSIVSSSLLARIAERHGLRYAETLTGFKWIARVEGLAFGYEEALGYCVDPAAVRDKDGVSATVLVAELAASLKAAGRSLADALDELALTYGLHATAQLSVRVSDLREIAAAMARLRSSPPSVLGGRAVELVQDLSAGVDGLPPTDGLRLRLAGDARAVVRPSGTEPKLKAYLEVVEAVPDGDVAAARARADAALRAIRSDLAAAAGVPG
jgi:phosphomannomutase